MTKKEIVSVVAENLGVTKKATDEVVTALFEAITNELKTGNEVAINGFGKFSVTERSAREGINPKTKEKVHIPAKKSVKFKAMGEIKSL